MIGVGALPTDESDAWDTEHERLSAGWIKAKRAERKALSHVRKRDGRIRELQRALAAEREALSNLRVELDRATQRISYLDPEPEW